MSVFISLDNLKRFLAKLRDLFVQKEYRTGSSSEWKVLSDNNLTDELKARIERSGTSNFSGAYSDLTGKPSIGGHQIASGDQTASSLGLATPSDVSSAASSARSGAVSDVKQLGYQTSAQVESAITAKGYQTGSQVDSKVSAAKSELQSSITSAVSSVYKPKGSCQFSSLPELTSARVGDVWNITDDFTTTDSFAEGAGRKYPAGTNVVRVTVSNKASWDVLSGAVDLSGYLQRSDMTAATDEQIDGLFA